jgi:hypothetical protein
MAAIPNIADAAGFKALVEQHVAEGWANLDNDKKLFVVWYIRSGYSTHSMTDVGVSDRETAMYMSDPLVQAAISDIGKQYAEVTTFTRVGLQARLARALDMALGEVERPHYDKAGDKQFRKVVDLAAAARLLEMAEKYIRDPDSIGDSNTPAPWEPR